MESILVFHYSFFAMPFREIWKIFWGAKLSRNLERSFFAIKKSEEEFVARLLEIRVWRLLKLGENR